MCNQFPNEQDMRGLIPGRAFFFPFLSFFCLGSGGGGGGGGGCCPLFFFFFFGGGGGGGGGGGCYCTFVLFVYILGPFI